jgi:hypothetical protein
MSAPTSIIAQGLVNYPEAGDGSVAYGAGTIRSGSVGIPAAATFVDNVYNIEMAELQLYTGVTLDASVEENRRAFIRSDRRPVKHVMVDGILMPAAALLLGKMPEIWMHGSQNWIAGKNTGTLGNFAPSGTRNPYPGPGD